MNKRKSEIIQLLKRKQENCSRLLQKVEDQTEAVNIQADSQVTRIIGDKEELIAELNETDQKIADLVKGLDEVTRKLLIGECEDLVHRIEGDLEKIIALETVCQEKLNQVKSEVVEKIVGLKNGQVLLKGYGVSPRIKPKISKNI